MGHSRVTSPAYARRFHGRLTALTRDRCCPTSEGHSMQDPAELVAMIDAALERRLERLGLHGKEEAWTDRYLMCEHILDPATARARQRFEAVARFSRDMIAHRWVRTRQSR